PALFVSPDNTFRTSFFMMWLRVRPVFLWRLSLPTGTKFYSNKDWRKMLESADGRKLSSLKGRTEMLQELKDVVADSRQYGIEIDVDNIATATAFWRGAPVIVLNNGMPESDVVVAAIWELYEINFRMELLILDRKLIPEPARDDERDEWMERETVINQCWPGLMFRPDSGSPGLSSYDNAFDHYRRRIPFLKAFHHLVQSWPGPKPMELMNEFPVVDEDDLTPIRNVETALAHYYTRTFLKVYQRPATIPHYIT
ncbi:hypothetical protein FB446DRAFT_642123, partial [Lentinula raphanica]